MDEPSGLPQPDAPTDAPSDVPSDAPVAAFPTPFPAPLSAEPTVSVVIHEEPKRRHTGLLVAVALLLVAALGVGGFLLLRKGDEQPTFSLTEAADNAAATNAVAFTMTMNLMGEEVTADVETDAEKGLSHLTMDLGDSGLGVDVTMEMIADQNDKVIYLHSGFLEALGTEVDTDWIKMDEEFIAEQGGTGDLFGAAEVDNPLDAATLFDQAKSVTDLGFDEVDGVKVKHYEVVVDMAAALKAMPQLRQQFDQIDGDLPKELTYDVFVDEQNQIRRTLTVVKAAGTKVTVDMLIKTVDEPIVIEVPDPADVTDAAELL